MSQQTATAASSAPPSREGKRCNPRSDQAIPGSGSLCLNEIWLLARLKWEMAGRPDGDSSRFWLEAEQELLRERDVGLGPHIVKITAGR
jgi:Protein of unknown function (DUF2934)